MTDFDNKDLTGQEPQAPAEEQPAAPAAEPVSTPEAVTPHLTLEPDPVPPADPVSPAPEPSTESFHMPEPPQAPEPPKPEEPVYQQAAPSYTAQQPQNGVPQYQVPPYQNQSYGQPAPQGNYKPLYNVPPAGYVQKSRLAAGLLGFLFGTLGVHNYYLGFNTKATIQLIVSLAGGLLTCGIATVAMGIWAFVESILILSSNPSYMYDGNGVILRD